MADIFGLSREIEALRKQASQGYSSQWEQLPLKVMEFLADRTESSMRRDAHILNRFDSSIVRNYDNINISDISSIGKAKDNVDKLYQSFSEQYPHLIEEMDISYDTSNNWNKERLDNVNLFNANKHTFEKLQKEQKDIITKYSEMQTKEVSDPERFLAEKSKLLDFYRQFSALKSNLPKFKGIEGVEEFAENITRMGNVHSGILGNFRVLPINETIVNDMDLQGIMSALEGDPRELNQLLNIDLSDKTSDEKSQKNAILSAIQNYTDADKLLIKHADEFALSPDGKVSTDDGDISRASLMAEKDKAKEKGDILLKGYPMAMGYPLREFEDRYRNVSIPWKKTEDIDQILLENAELMKLYPKLNEEVLSNERKAWGNKDGEIEFTDYIKKKYEITDVDKESSTKAFDLEAIRQDTDSLIKSVFDEVESPVDPRNPGSVTKSVKYTTSKKTQAEIQDKYGGGVLPRLQKLYQLKTKFGEDSKKYKAQLKVLEDYIIKQEKKNQPRKKASPDMMKEFQEIDSQSGYSTYNKQFGIGR